MPSRTNPVSWFEIPVNDLARAKTFYGSALGVEMTELETGPKKMGWFPMEMGAAGSAGTLVEGDGYTPSHDGSLVYPRRQDRSHVGSDQRRRRQDADAADGNRPTWFHRLLRRHRRQSVKDPHMHQLTMTLVEKNKITHEWVFFAGGKKQFVVQLDLQRKK